MNTKNRNILIVLGIAIFLLGGLFLLFNKSHAYHELPKVKLKDDNNNVKQFALMVEQNKGTGDYQDKSEEYASAFPTEGFRLNADMSGCTDINGKEIENAIEYDYDNYTITVNTNKTAYCYLYYDIYEKPRPTIEVLREKDTNNSLTTDLVGGMYRYQGTGNIANWIIFGTKEECNKDEEDKCTNSNLNNMTYAEYVDKYMYRIIGITEEGQMYLLKETFLKEESVTGFAWNDEYDSTGSYSYSCPDGNCPEWNESDLFQRINGTANGTSAGKGGYSSKADTDIFVDNEYYDYLKSGDENGGEEASEWYNLIDNHDWYYGDTTTNSHDGNTLYNIETGKAETTHYVKGEDGSVTSQNYTWTNTVNAKISLMYLHDVAYAYPEGNPSNTNVKNSWIHFQKDGYNSSPTFEWLSTRWGIFSTSFTGVYARYVYDDGILDRVIDVALPAGGGARPVFYLSSEAEITGGDGAQNLPYILG